MNFLPLTRHCVCDLAGLSFSSHYREKIHSPPVQKTSNDSAVHDPAGDYFSSPPLKVGRQASGCSLRSPGGRNVPGGGEPVRGPRASGESRVQSPKPASLLAPNRAHNSEARLANEVLKAGKELYTFEKRRDGECNRAWGPRPHT